MRCHLSGLPNYCMSTIHQQQIPKATGPQGSKAPGASLEPRPHPQQDLDHYCKLLIGISDGTLRQLIKRETSPLWPMYTYRVRTRSL